MAKITIKDGSFKLEVDRKDLVEVAETPDGVVFNFKNGLQLHKNEQFMPSSVKQIIKNTADNFPGHDLIFELDNPKTPARVDAT
jgi:hypothetical protein